MALITEEFTTDNYSLVGELHSQQWKLVNCKIASLLFYLHAALFTVHAWVTIFSQRCYMSSPADLWPLSCRFRRPSRGWFTTMSPEAKLAERRVWTSRETRRGSLVTHTWWAENQTHCGHLLVLLAHLSTSRQSLKRRRCCRRKSTVLKVSYITLFTLSLHNKYNTSCCLWQLICCVAFRVNACFFLVADISVFWQLGVCVWN